MAELKEILNLNRLEAKEGVLHIKHETVETEKIAYEQRVAINGTITAPGNFIAKRKDQDDKLRSNVRYSYRDRFIKLETMEHFDEEFGYSIDGALIINPAFKELGINENKLFHVKELVKHIRMNMFYFESKDQHLKIVQGLQNFNAQLTADIKQINDNRGNIESLYKTTLKSNSELAFQVLMPVFIGEPPKSIRIEIATEADNSNVKFWLESPDLIELFQKDTKTIIDGELKRFPEEFVFIEQ